MRLVKITLTLTLCLTFGAIFGQLNLKNPNHLLRFKVGAGFSNQTAFGVRTFYKVPDDVLDGNKDYGQRVVSSYLIQLPLQAEFWPIHTDIFGLGIGYSHTLGTFTEATSNSYQYGPRAFYRYGDFSVEATWASTAQRFSFRRDSLIGINRTDVTNSYVNAKGRAISVGLIAHISNTSFVKLSYINEKFTSTSSTTVSSALSQNGFSLSFDKLKEFEVCITYFPKYPILEDNRVQYLETKLKDPLTTFEHFRIRYIRNIDFLE